jgi:sulfate permease, SulP family
MVLAPTLLAILLYATPLARFGPLATRPLCFSSCCGILESGLKLAVCGGFHGPAIAVRGFATFTVTVVKDLNVAIGVGMALAALPLSGKYTIVIDPQGERAGCAESFA